MEQFGEKTLSKTQAYELHNKFSCDRETVENPSPTSPTSDQQHGFEH